LRFEGDPIDALHLASEFCDLVVTGHDTHFHGRVREQLPDMLAKLLLITPRPVLVCGNAAPDGQDVLIAYDGSLPAMRAVQVFALLGLRSGQRVHITAIHSDKGQAARQLSGAVHYLRGHGYDVETNLIGTTVHPADVLRIEVADRKIGTVVMGVYGHRGLRERLFGSTTTQLAETRPALCSSTTDRTILAVQIHQEQQRC
jgi:nucleotide-binding universal stress UspA family protein